MKGSHSNRKASSDAMSFATQVIHDAYPQYEVVWGSHGDYGGGRAPRDHTLSLSLSLFQASRCMGEISFKRDLGVAGVADEHHDCLGEEDGETRNKQ